MLRGAAVAVVEKLGWFFSFLFLLILFPPHLLWKQVTSGANTNINKASKWKKNRTSWKLAWKGREKSGLAESSPGRGQSYVKLFPESGFCYKFPELELGLVKLCSSRGPDLAEMFNRDCCCTNPFQHACINKHQCLMGAFSSHFLCLLLLLWVQHSPSVSVLTLYSVGTIGLPINSYHSLVSPFWKCPRLSECLHMFAFFKFIFLTEAYNVY